MRVCWKKQSNKKPKKILNWYVVAHGGSKDSSTSYSILSRLEAGKIQLQVSCGDFVDFLRSWEHAIVIIGDTGGNNTAASIISDGSEQLHNSVVDYQLQLKFKGDALQSGTTTVEADGPVKVEDITVYRDPHRVCITFTKNIATGVKDRSHLPLRFELYQNHPNPLNPSATISCSLQQRSDVKITIFDLLGRKVRNLVQESKPGGRYSVLWDGRDKAGRWMSSGTYFYRMQVDGAVTTRRMLFLK